MADRASARPGWRLVALLYPLGAASVAAGVLLASLVASGVGAPVLAPIQAVAAGLVLGMPATYAAAPRIRRLTEAKRAR